MIAFIRFALPLLVVLTIIFLALRLWSRRAHYRRLSQRWQQNQKGDREAFLRRGMARYDRSWRRRMIWGVYLVPICAIAAIVYAANYM